MKIVPWDLFAGFSAVPKAFADGWAISIEGSGSTIARGAPDCNNISPGLVFGVVVYPNILFIFVARLTAVALTSTPILTVPASPSPNTKVSSPIFIDSPDLKLDVNVKVPLLTPGIDTAPPGAANNLSSVTDDPLNSIDCPPQLD